MGNSTIIFLGAGFSVEAKIPVQNRILSEMQKEPNLLFGENKPESVKFLESFIDVGIFILNKFSHFDTSQLIQAKAGASFVKTWKDALLETESSISILSLQSMASKFKEQGITDFFDSMIQVLQNENMNFQLKETVNAYYYRELVDIKEKIRKGLLAENPSVDLEDIFTLFDKSFKQNENWEELTYVELDHLRHALLRLFTYYFGQKISAFYKSKTKYYDGFIQFVKKSNVSIITTNWDPIVEILFKKNNIDFKTHEELNSSERFIDIIKLHGSINWFKCNNCGTYQIAKYPSIATHLLNDETREECGYCKNFATSNQVILNQRSLLLRC